MPAGAGHDLPERIQLLHRHRKLFPEKVDQSRHTRRSSGHHDALDILPAGRGTEEIKSLLDLERQNVRNRAKDLRALILADAGEGFALFEPLGIVEVQVEFLLQGVGVLVDAYGLNDARGGTPLDLFAGELRTLIDGVRVKIQPLIVLLGPYYMTGFD